MHLTLEEARLDPAEDPELLVYFQVPPEARSPYEYLANLDKGEPVDVPGFWAIEDALIEAGPGAHGMVLIGPHGTDVDHIVAAVNRNGRIVYLDGQLRDEADLPRDFRSSVPAGQRKLPRAAIVARTEPWPHGQWLGAGGRDHGAAEAETALVPSRSAPAYGTDIIGTWQ